MTGLLCLSLLLVCYWTVLRSSHISLHASLPSLRHPSLHPSIPPSIPRLSWRCHFFPRREPHTRTHAHAHTRTHAHMQVGDMWSVLTTSRGHRNIFTPTLISELVTWRVTVKSPHIGPRSTRGRCSGSHRTSLDDFYTRDENEAPPPLLSSCTLRRTQGF